MQPANRPVMPVSPTRNIFGRNTTQPQSQPMQQFFSKSQAPTNAKNSRNGSSSPKRGASSP